MCAQAIAALLGLVAGCLPVVSDPILAPADPARATVWHPPPPPLAGLARYAPVAARSDWGVGPSATTKSGDRDKSMQGKPMPNKLMPGMDMPDMGGRR